MKFSFTLVILSLLPFFFFNDTATTEIYTLSLHDALPICHPGSLLGSTHSQILSGIPESVQYINLQFADYLSYAGLSRDRKSTRLNSSHLVISYAVFCLKKKKNDAEILEELIIIDDLAIMV